ncbi:glycosyltransferase involved in cell wall biosynthesis [Algoriphagus sp. 4150]|uniref:glycosyltransferase family 2 protein n=1 Tax=Algoriphagus sp. 4150 TaxID=2817756 RepID=UPI002866714A|nr:glycosyltransferase family A protein [Algoriphagus sp. 4150]MDR7129113.1 glycosyltransferase involved in cell wall biosynthesis [Algoriphagus sp. 4150]
MKPTISIIIPCYNQANYLNETAESALNANYPELEIIIINDGSTDNTEEIAEELTEKYKNVYLLNQPNSGVTIARNAGIEFSNGKYILPLDADDLIYPAYIPDAIEILEKRPEVKVVYCKAVKFDEESERNWKLKPFSLKSLAKDNMIFVSGIFRKSDCLAVGGFDDQMTMGRADWEFWINLLKNGGEVVQLPYVGFKYRLTKSGSMRKKTGSNELKRKRIAFLNAKHKDFFEKHLNGPLRFQRTWSRPYNTLMKFLGKS